ncbi:hypothetical protein F4810DRAFT_653773 [Camillea tinctor]|nr:hypothetical protein F4810DRAFT_653773 [Camillea tinctor]
MSLRSSLFDFGSRNYICRSCQSALRKTRQWPIRYSSQAAFAQGQRKSSHAPHEEAGETNETNEINGVNEANEAYKAYEAHEAYEAHQTNERLKALDSLGLLNDKSPGLTVNYFEQGSRGRLRRLRNADEFNESLTDARDVEEGLKQLEQQLEQATRLTKTIEELGGRDQASKLRERFVSRTGALRLSPKTDRDQLVPEAWSASPASIMAQISNPDVRLREIERRPVAVFNSRVHMVAKRRELGYLTPKSIGALWGTYCPLRKYIEKGFVYIPPGLWNLLWHVVSWDHPDNKNRMSHIFYLSKDMHQAGVPLTPQQQVLALEAMFIEGWREEAAINHKRLAATLGSHPEVSLEFWQLGLRMQAIMGNIGQTEKMVESILQLPQHVDPRFIMPYIGLCAKSPETLIKAFGAYRRLRTSLGKSITAQDYDRIIAYFLAADHADLALCIFVDMMKSGKIDLFQKKDYPKSVANPIFFGKWLKRLIGNGDLEGAYKVFLLMRTMGIVPLAIHVNGLIGAWYRSGLAINMQKGETTAWLMINARLQFVRKRKQSLALAASRISLRQHGNGWPRATLETFSLIAQNYRERGLHTKMEELWGTFKEAEVAPDSFMANQLLLSYLHNEKGRQVVSMFLGLVKQFRIAPDPPIFLTLWKSLAVNRLAVVEKEDAGKESKKARQIFASMMKYLGIFLNGGLDVLLARKILHSFRKTQDTVGLLLAYRALRQIFGFTPPDAVAIEILAESEDLEKLTRGRGMDRLMTARVRVDLYLKQKHAGLIKSGALKENDRLPPEIILEEINNYVELCLQTNIITENRGEKGAIEQKIRQAAKEMGLADSVEGVEGV